MDCGQNSKRPRSSSTYYTPPPFNRQKTGSSSSPSSSFKTAFSTYTHSESVSSHESSRSDIELSLERLNGQQNHYLRVERETHGLWVGPMDPGLFLEKFLPQAAFGRPAFHVQPFSDIAHVLDESKVFELFIEAMSPFTPTLKLVDTHSSPDIQWDGIAVDLSTYPVSLDPQDEVVETDFSRMEIPLSLNKKETSDPFTDIEEYLDADDHPRFPFEREGLKYELIRGQIGSYTSCLTAAQFRLHTFSVLICGQWARIIRWDRSGAIVTRKFAYAEEEHLVEFFWRYSHTPHEGTSRGHDPTVKTLPLDTHLPTQEEMSARVKLAKANAIHREFRTMAIPDRDTTQEFQFIISYPPKPKRYSPFGRVTRPMLAFDLDKNMLVFIKDYWRSVSDHDQKEGDIYKLLQSANVPYLAPFGKGNDVRDHGTLTDVMKSEGWAFQSGKVESLRHYRMSLEEIGRPLSQFKSSHELVTAIADAMEAHEFAYHDAKILHRDISAGNILITPAGRGMLIDWDLCLNLNGMSEEMRRPERRGTWEFMSVALLTSLKHLHEVFDDQESSLYVLLWNVLRYTPHNRVSKIKFDLQIFNELTYYNGEGCDHKRLFLVVRYRYFAFEDRPLLHKLFWELCNVFSARYEELDEEEEKLHRDITNKNRPWNYYNRLDKLNSRKWLVQTIRKHLEPREEWPETDGPCRNPGIE